MQIHKFMIEFRNQNDAVLMTAFTGQEQKTSLDEVFKRIDVIADLSRRFEARRFEDIYEPGPVDLDSEILESIDKMFDTAYLHFQHMLEKCVVEIAPGHFQQLLSDKQAMAIYFLRETKWLLPHARLYVRTPSIGANPNKYRPSEIVTITTIEEEEDQTIQGTLSITDDIVEYTSPSIGVQQYRGYRNSIVGIISVPLTLVPIEIRSTNRDCRHGAISSQIRTLYNSVQNLCDGVLGPYIP